MKNQDNQQGFTIIEVMVALTLLSVGFLAAATMQATSLGSTDVAGRITKATTLASDQVEALMVQDYDSVEDGTRAEDGFEISWEVFEQSSNPHPTITIPSGSKLLKVEVKRWDKELQRSVIVHFIRAERI